VALLRPRADFYTDAHPGPRDVLLVIEVSESSLQPDRDVKVPLYARHAIPEVWLVDVAQRRVLRFTSPVGGVYRQRGVIDPTRPDPCSRPGRSRCGPLGALPGGRWTVLRIPEQERVRSGDPTGPSRHSLMGAPQGGRRVLP
jgi:hypothetical protein